jgi:F0F1-type ATP synthase epsilon subunit
MTEDELTLQVLSPDGPLLEADRLLEVLVPLADGGPIGIRPKHASLIAETVSGPVRYQTNREIFEVELLAGILSIRDNVVTILSAGEMEEVETAPESTSDPYNDLTQALETEREVRESDQ